jgi:hypothetical protein
MKKLLFILSIGLFSCTEINTITPKEAFNMYGATGGLLVNQYAHINPFTGRKTCYIEVDITDKQGKIYQRNVEVSSDVYWHSYQSLTGTYILFK